MAELIQKPKKKRVSAPKSRSGCSTCKTRHKKCDELRPACTPCTSTGRTCDFLQPTTIPIPAIKIPLRPAKKRTTSSPLPKLAPLISAPTYGTPIPIHTLPHFRYFTHLLTNSTYSPFNTGTFQTLILQLSHQEPCILHAILSISSLLKYQAKNNPPAATKTYKVESHVFFAKAVKGLKRKLLEENEEIKWEVVIAGSVLISTFELLGGSEESASRNLIAGSEMLRLRLGSSRSSPTLRSLSRSFTHFNLQITTFDTFWSDPYIPLPIFPPSFDSLITARHSLDDVTAYIAAVFKPVKPPTQTLPYFPLPHYLAQNLSLLQNLLNQWEHKFEELARGKEFEKEGGSHTGVKILRVSYLSAKINLQTLFYADEDCFDAYLTSFRTIIALAEEIMFPVSNSSSTPQNQARDAIDRGGPTFTFEASLIPSLYFSGLKCRDAVIRKKIRYLLGYCGVEGIWIGVAMKAVLRWVYAVEGTHCCSSSPGAVMALQDSESGSGFGFGMGGGYSEFDIGSSTRVDVDIGAELNNDVEAERKDDGIAQWANDFIPNPTRLRNLKISVSKSESCAYVVSRRKFFSSSSFPFPSPNASMPQGYYSWEYISGVVRFEEEDTSGRGSGKGLGEEKRKEQEEIVRNMVVMYRVAMERLDVGLEGKEEGLGI